MSGAGLFLFPSATPSHLLKDPQQAGLFQQYSPVQSSQQHIVAMASNNNRKRKADSDLDENSMDRMSSSSPSPSQSTLQLPAQLPAHNAPRHNITPRTIKKPRTLTTHGRPLTLPRLLETLSADEMRGVLQQICQVHPDIGAEIVNTAPRPSVQSALGVLQRYESKMRAAFPYGDRATSDYSYNRVRPALLQLLDALKDFTPHFLPPHEPAPVTSLEFLDNATALVHALPDWDSQLHTRHKSEAYDEIARAWALAIREASKRAGGLQLQYGGWDAKLLKHHEVSGGKLSEAVNEMRLCLGWMEGAAGPAATGGAQPSIREQLLGGTYGVGQPQAIGTW